MGTFLGALRSRQSDPEGNPIDSPCSRNLHYMNPNRFKSTFYSNILFYSRFHPESVAVAFGSQEVTYGEFVRDIERATRQLASRLSSRSGLAMVSLTHPYLHWVLTIALGRVGMTSVTAYDPANSNVLDLIRPDLVFVDAQTAATDTRFVAVTEEWIGRDGDKLAPFVDPEHQADAPFRLILSSGTTGIPKKILLTHRLSQHRLLGTALGTALTGSSSRTLPLVGFDTAGGYQFPMTTWFVGGRVVLRMAGEDPYQTILRKGVTYAFMAPVQLEQIVRSMPAGAWPIPGLTVAVAGSTLPRLLSEKTRARLTPSLVLIYGSTEAGLIARTHAALTDAMAGVTGVVQPEVDLQIVDAADNVLPHGEVGAVRSWSPDCVSGYLDAEASGADSEEIFRDGWFYPGDAGVLSSTGMLTIVGRTKELMNLGGVKLSPNAIEEALTTCPGVTDIAAFSLDHEGGVATPWVAVVRGSGYDQAALSNEFKRVFPRLPELKFVHADVIPRNQMGKIQRNIIRERVQRSLDNVS
jgi:acyl-CoA synthetase (AMP-forming)/AMP-acid ligase II